MKTFLAIMEQARNTFDTIDKMSSSDKQFTGLAAKQLLQSIFSVKLNHHIRKKSTAK